MAITATNKGAGASTTADPITTSSVAYANNKLYLVTVSTRATTAPTVSSITGGGITWVLVQHNTSGNTNMSVYRGLVTSGASTGTLSIDLSAAPQRAMWSIDEFDGVDLTGTNGSGAIVQAVNATWTNSLTTVTATLASFGSANNAGYMACGHNSQETTSVEAGWTALMTPQSGGATNAHALGNEWRLSGSDLTASMTYATSNRGGGMGIEIKAAAAGPVTASNTAEGGSDGTTVTTGNSGGASGDAWTTVDSTSTMEFDNARTINPGSMSYHSAKAGATNSYVGWGASPSPDTATYYFRGYFNFQDPPTAHTYLATFYDGGTYCVGVSMSTGGYVRILDQNGVSQTTDIYALSPDTWYRIEAFFDVANQQATLKIYYRHNNVELDSQSTGTSEDFGGVNLDGVRVGAGHNTTSLTYEMWFDDIKVADDTWIGPSAGDADITPTTVAGTTSVPTPTVAANADVTPATVNATATIPTPSVVGDANVALATVSATTTISTPTVDVVANVSITPSPVVGATTIPTPVVTGDADLTLSTITGTTAIGTPSVTADANVTLAAVVGSTTIPTPAVTADANVTPATVVATTSIPTPTVAGDVDITPDTVTASTTIPTPPVTTDAPDALVNLNTVVATASIPTPEISTDQNLTMTTVVGATSIPTPAVAADAAITPATVTATATIPTPTVVGDANVTPATVVATTTIPTPSVVATGLADVTPATVTAAATIPTPVISVDVNVTPATVVGTTSIPTPGVTADASVMPNTVLGVGVVFTPAAAANVDITTELITAVASIPTPSVVITSPDANVMLTTVVATANVFTPSMGATEPVHYGTDPEGLHPRIRRPYRPILRGVRESVRLRR